ncbi:related to Probable kinetochore protein NUF2 [Saccharomycodes ludwigii]|uniref:Related to Probable kinetochore protein NUF2 n=1 Tax=Saccharomycodes ludwigii TaxID=36035 RepID=A0A376B4U1_9ASCO|nr:related to Probable kinetochore protein NUF2 [Saccharomycodes ludwigii]
MNHYQAKNYQSSRSTKTPATTAASSLKGPNTYTTDVFPILSLDELVTCLQSCDFSIATKASLSKPTSAFIITLYKQIIDSFMGVSPDDLINDLRRKERGDGGSTSNVNNNNINYETIHTLVLNKICYKFFQDIGVLDFNIMDLYKPEVFRTIRLLSAVINYARFREERMYDCDKFIATTEYLLEQLKQKFDERNSIVNQLGKYKEWDFDNVGMQLEKLETDNKNVEQNLRKLVTTQETLTIDYDNYRSVKQKLLIELEQLSFQEIELESERDKLIKYSKMDIGGMDNVIKDLQNQLDEKKKTLTSLEHKQHDLYLAIEKFQKCYNDLTQLLNYIIRDIQETHIKEVELKELKQQNELTENKLKNILDTNILMKINILKSQLEQQESSWQELRINMEQKSSENDERITDLQKQYKEEVIPRVEKQKKFVTDELINGKLRELNSEFDNIKQSFQSEIMELEREYSRLAQYLNQYIQNVVNELGD